MKIQLCSILAAAMFLFAQTPQFTSGVLKDDNGNDINGSMPNPCIVDWDSDGDMDLVVGVFNSQQSMFFYENTGSDDNPVLSTGTAMHAGGNPISLSAN